MADNTQLFEDILLELSYRSDEGYPDFSKPEHITILSEILTEWGMTNVKYELIKNLLKEDEEEDKKYFHKGKGVYVKIGDKDKEDAQTFKKDDSGKYSPVDKDGEESEEKSKTKISGADDFQHAPDINKEKPKQDIKVKKVKNTVQDRITDPEIKKEVEQDIKEEEIINEEILSKIPSLKELSSDLQEGYKQLLARGHLFGRRSNAGFGKNNFGIKDRDTLVANKENLLKGYNDAKPELVEKFVRSVRSAKVSEDFVRESYDTLPPKLKTYLKGAGQAGKVVGKNHFIGYEKEDGSITSNIEESKKDENGNPIPVRGSIPNTDRARLVWRIYLEQGGMCAYTGLPLDVESMDLEHVVGIMNKDKGDPSEEDLLNRENERNHVITTTRANQRKKDLNMNEFYEREVSPLEQKSDEDFKAMESAIEEVGIMQPRTEQTAARFMGEVMYSIKGGGSISQSDYLDMEESQRPQLTTTDLGTPKIKDALFSESITRESLQKEFDYEDERYNEVRTTLSEQLEGSDKKKASQIKTKLGKRTITMLGLAGNLMAPDRRTNTISSDTFYRGFALAIADQDKEGQEKLKELWNEARKFANSDEIRLGGRQKDAFVEYIRERDGIPESILNEPRYKKVWSYKDKDGQIK